LFLLTFYNSILHIMVSVMVIVVVMVMVIAKVKVIVTVMRAPGCYHDCIGTGDRGVTLVLQWCYTCVTVVLHLCYSGVT
jgi:hypothetical protein